MRKVIIIGATSGIGKGLAKVFADNNYKVGITGRRTELLNELEFAVEERTINTNILGFTCIADWAFSSNKFCWRTPWKQSITSIQCDKSISNKLFRRS